MGKLCFKTRNNTNPQGKPRVYFTCHKKDFGKYFAEVSDMILKNQNCAIYYYDDIDSITEEEKELDLSQMQLFVIPVTENFLGKGCSAYDFDFKYAIKNHIPVLPLLSDGKLTTLFNKKCGNLQYLLRNDTDETAISYDIKFKNFLSSVLIGDELASKIRAAFDAYVFLSYRKKDRKYAQELMRLIHKNDFCRDIAIWYDEFLVPGENFNDAISDAMKKSKLFAMVVTPNLVNEENYVMTTEYPMAKESGMPLLPAEAVATDKAALREKFKDIPECTDIHNSKMLAASLMEGLKNIAVRTNDASPEHNFFIGLAYLSGIDVEVDHKRAVSLITFAADKGLGEAAKKLATMYKIGEGVSINYNTAVKWQQKLCDILKKKYEESGADADRKKYFNEKQALYNLYADLEKHEEVIKIANELLEEGRPHAKTNADKSFLYSVSNRVARSYQRLRHFEEAEKVFIFCMKGYEQLCEENPDSYPMWLSTIYNNLATLYHDMTKFEEAERFYLKALVLREKKNAENSGAYDDRCARVYGNLGSLYRDMKKYNKAEEFFEKDLEIRERLAKTESDSALDHLGDAYSQLSGVYESTERYSESEARKLKAFEIRKKLAAKNPTLYEGDLVASYNGLGSLYKDTERYAEAEKMYLEAYKINERRKNENPAIFEQSYATSCHNLGLLYNNIKRYDLAEEYYKKAIEIRERLHKEAEEVYDGVLSGSYAQMGHNLRSLKRLDEAEEFYLKDVEICKKRCERTPGVYENNLASAYGNLGILYKAKRMFGKAEELYLKAVEIKEELAQKNPAAYESTLALWYNHTALLYSDTNRRQKAIEYTLKAIEIRERLAKENPAAHEGAIAAYYSNIASDYEKQKMYDEAEKMYLKSLGIRERLWEQNSAAHEGNLATLYNNIALFYKERDKSKYKLSEEYYLKCIAIREEQAAKFPKVYGNNLRTAFLNIAYLYLAQKKYFKALIGFMKASSRGREEESNVDRVAGLSYGFIKISEDISGISKSLLKDILKNISAYILYKVGILTLEWACKKRVGLFEDNLIRSYKSFASFADKLEFKQSAADIYIKAINVRKAQSDKKPLEYENQLAIDLNSLGEFYIKWGKNNEAVSAYKRSIKVREEVYNKNGAYKDKLARDYNNLALLLKGMGRLDEAEPLYLKAIKMNSELGNEQRANLAINYSNMGYLYYEKGDTEKEAEYFEKSLTIYRELAEKSSKYYADMSKAHENLKDAKKRLENKKAGV